MITKWFNNYNSIEKEFLQLTYMHTYIHTYVRTHEHNHNLIINLNII